MSAFRFLSVESRIGIENALGIVDVESFPLADCTLLWFRLRAISDSRDTFPRGKWATLQEIERRITETIADEYPVAARPAGQERR